MLRIHHPQEMGMTSRQMCSQKFWHGAVSYSTCRLQYSLARVHAEVKTPEMQNLDVRFIKGKKANRCLQNYIAPLQWRRRLRAPRSGQQLRRRRMGRTRRAGALSCWVSSQNPSGYSVLRQRAIPIFAPLGRIFRAPTSTGAH
jgi:hypothetical protein